MLTLLAGCLSVATRSADADRRPPPGGESRRSPDLSRRPSEDDARGQIAVLVAAALTRDRVRYCAAVEFEFLCESQWDRLGGAAAVPEDPPHLLGMREDTGARILVLCGRDGLGRPYRSELPVMTYDDGPRVTGGPYWQTVDFGGVFTDDPAIVVTEPTAPVSLPPACG